MQGSLHIKKAVFITALKIIAGDYTFNCLARAP
jgi:hypothetical protein